MFGGMDFLWSCLLKIGASAVCGALLGLERKHRFQVVGMRTLILISVSSALLSMLSYSLTEIQAAKNFYGGDPTRIIAGVVSGIGFLGGGAIIHQGMNIKGLTSAAIVWTASALGLAIGAGLYFPAFTVLCVALFLLIVLERVEERLFPASRNKTLQLVFGEDNLDLTAVKQTIQKCGFKVTDLNISCIMASRRLILRYMVKAPDKDSYSEVISALAAIGPLEEFSVTN